MAKVKVTSGKQSLEELRQYMPEEWIPQAYGGTCTRPYSEYPAEVQLRELLGKLGAL